MHVHEHTNTHTPKRTSLASKLRFQMPASISGVCDLSVNICLVHHLGPPWGHFGFMFGVTLGSISTKRSVSTRKSDFLNSNQRSSHFWVMSVRSIYTGPVDDLKLALAPHVVNANWLRGKPKVESRTQKQIRLGGWGQWYHHSRHCSPICRSRRNAR